MQLSAPIAKKLASQRQHSRALQGNSILQQEWSNPTTITRTIKVQHYQRALARQHGKERAIKSESKGKKGQHNKINKGNWKWHQAGHGQQLQQRQRGKYHGPIGQSSPLKGWQAKGKLQRKTPKVKVKKKRPITSVSGKVTSQETAVSMFTQKGHGRSISKQMRPRHHTARPCACAPQFHTPPQAAIPATTQSTNVMESILIPGIGHQHHPTTSSFLRLRGADDQYRTCRACVPTL